MSQETNALTLLVWEIMSPSSPTCPWRFLLSRLVGRHWSATVGLKQRVRNKDVLKAAPPPKKMFGVACENLGLQWHVIYDSWIVLINLWISVRVGFLFLCFPLPADVNNMAQLACRDLSYCVSSVFYASTALSAGASLGTINPNKTTSPKCCVLPQLRWFSDHSKVNVTAGDSK